MKLSKEEELKKEAYVCEVVKTFSYPPSISQLMEKTGCTRWIVEKALIKNNIPYKKGPDKKWNQDVIDKITEELNEGNSFASVALRYGVSKQRISNILNQNGYKLLYVKSDDYKGVQTHHRVSGTTQEDAL